jgi:hypothetical protein
VLPLQDGTPDVPQATFFAYNSRLSVQRLLHQDGANTLYLEFNVPPGTMASLDGRRLTVQDSVLLTVEPIADRYGLVLSPSGLAFTIDAAPTAAFSFAMYGDFSVAEGSVYESAAEYAAALQIWFEVTPGRWRPVSGSGPAGSDRVEGRVDQPGVYIVAAPR